MPPRRRTSPAGKVASIDISCIEAAIVDLARRQHRQLTTRQLLAIGLHVLVAGHEVDAYFPTERLIVECDGWGFHNTRASFEADRDRDADHLALGLPTVRVTKRRLSGAPVREAARLHRILAGRR